MQVGIVTLSILFLLYVSEASVKEEERIKELYTNFRKRFPRPNITEEEIEDRFENFKETLRRIEVYNSDANSTTYGITVFSDWFDDELELFTKPLLGGSDFVFRGPTGWYFRLYKPLHHGPLPNKFSWQSFAQNSRMRDQLRDRGRPCNSCWANTVLTVVEILHKIRFGKSIHLSDDELIDCDFTNKGCISGSTKRAFIRGYLTGYRMYNRYKRYQSCPKFWDIKINELYTFKPGAVREMEHFIAYHGPIAVNMAWPFRLFQYAGYGIIRGYECERFGGRRPQHATLIVGYGEENGVKYWIMRNSYGTGWGQEGYFRLERGVDACRVESYASSGDFKNRRKQQTSPHNYHPFISKPLF